MKERLTDARFQAARARVLGEEQERQGIGTLGEKTLHRMLKLTVEPNEACHEIKVCGRVADVVLGEDIVEIQTRSLSKLSPKLATFLPERHVTVIYPLPNEKYIRWLDPVTGELGERRKSPKHASVFDSIVELCRLGEHLTHADLTVCLVFLDMEEYRYLNGWSADRKRGSERLERMANRLCDVVCLSTPQDYRRVFLPTALGDAFTVKDYARLTRLKPRWAYAAIRLLERLGIVTHADTRGREHVYAPT